MRIEDNWIIILEDMINKEIRAKSKLDLRLWRVLFRATLAVWLLVWLIIAFTNYHHMSLSESFLLSGLLLAIALYVAYPKR